MSKKFFFLVTLLLSSFLSYSEGELRKMTIRFDDLTTDEGYVMVLVQDESERDVEKLVISVFEGSAVVTVHLPPGKYAVTAYHDINGDQELNMNFLGVPQEPYGLSTNLRPILTRPKVSEHLIDLTTNDQTIEIELKGYP